MPGRQRVMTAEKFGLRRFPIKPVETMSALVRLITGPSALVDSYRGTCQRARVSKLQTQRVTKQNRKEPGEILCWSCRPLAKDLSVS
jgi:hypothetical protein